MKKSAIDKVISIFGSQAEFARAISTPEHAFHRSTVNKWVVTKMVPAKYILNIISAAKRRAHGKASVPSERDFLLAYKK